jgi:DNA-binding LytR/AlgR family response regulator
LSSIAGGGPITTQPTIAGRRKRPRIALNLIDWAEADRNYLKLHIGANTYTVRGTIEGIEKKLDSEQFLRINRSSLIRIDFTREFAEMDSWRIRKRKFDTDFPLGYCGKWTHSLPRN